MKPARQGPTVPRDDARRLRAVIATLVRRFSLSERADVSCCGLTVAQAAMLEALRGEGPVRLGPLARRLGITPSTLTRNLERLEKEGLVERAADAEDARASLTRLTRRGEAAARLVRAQEEAFASTILSRMAGERRGEVLTALEELVAAVRGATETCCPGAFDHLMKGVAARGASGRNRERETCCED